MSSINNRDLAVMVLTFDDIIMSSWISRTTQFTKIKVPWNVIVSPVLFQASMKLCWSGDWPGSGSSCFSSSSPGVTNPTSVGRRSWPIRKPRPSSSGKRRTKNDERRTRRRLKNAKVDGINANVEVKGNDAAKLVSSKPGSRNDILNKLVLE